MRRHLCKQQRPRHGLEKPKTVSSRTVCALRLLRRSGKILLCYVGEPRFPPFSSQPRQPYESSSEAPVTAVEATAALFSDETI